MSKPKKSIDGLTINSPNQSLGLNSKPKTQNKKRSVKPNPKLTKNPASAPVMRPVKNSKKRNTNDEFLKPVQSFDLELTSKDLKNSKKSPKKHKKWSKKRKIAIGIISFLLICLVVLLIWGNAILAKLTNGNDNIFNAIGTIWNNVELKADKNGRTNIIVFGTGGYDMEGTEGDDLHDGAQLTDSIMIISANQETKDVATMSVPRDLKVSMGCAAGKINEVYWCANQDGKNELAGAEAMKKQASKIYGLDFQYYIHADWTALIRIVDSIGGITVTLDEDIADPWTKTYIKAGEPTTLNGEQALGLARARHGTAAGDFTRGTSQQKILVAIERKILEKGLSLNEAFNLVGVVGDNIRTDFNTDEIKTIINIASKDSNFDLNNMRQILFTGLEDKPDFFMTKDISGISYVVPTAGLNDYTDIQAYVKKQLSNNPVERENAAILVLNGSGVSGTASKEKTILEKEEYNVKTVDDAPTSDYQGYTIFSLTDKKPGTKAALESKYKVSVKSANELPAGINPTGYDFVIIVGKQPEPTTTTNSSSTNQ